MLIAFGLSFSNAKYFSMPIYILYPSKNEYKANKTTSIIIHSGVNASFAAVLGPDKMGTSCHLFAMIEI